MSTRALLDVNILVALFDRDHPHHDVAHDWFTDAQAAWATCSLAQNAVIRILSNPRYHPIHQPVVDVVGSLRRFCESPHHQFWAAPVSLTDQSLFDVAQVRGYRQLTDVYLLGLAKKMGGYLATLDRTIPLSAVRGATREMLQVIAPAD